MKNMTDRILGIIRRYGKMTMTEIVNEINCNSAYKLDYARHVSDMANNGKLVRSWNEYGTPYYSIA